MSLLRCAFVIATLFLSISNCHAAVAVGSADWTGSRTSALGHIIKGDDWAADLDPFSIAWTISESAGIYTYSYTLTQPGPPGISHWILELSFLEDDITVTADRDASNAEWDSVFDTQSIGSTETNLWLGVPDNLPSNPLMPAGGVYGVKFDEGSLATVSFTSTHAPVWGDFYAKGGSTSYAYNAGFGTDPTTSDYMNWIPRPNGVEAHASHAPEATSVAIWSIIGIASASYCSLRKRRAATL